MRGVIAYLHDKGVDVSVTKLTKEIRQLSKDNRLSGYFLLHGRGFVHDSKFSRALKPSEALAKARGIKSWSTRKANEAAKAAEAVAKSASALAVKTAEGVANTAGDTAVSAAKMATSTAKVVAESTSNAAKVAEQSIRDTVSNSGETVDAILSAPTEVFEMISDLISPEEIAQEIDEQERKAAEEELRSERRSFWRERFGLEQAS
jgi:hypothetical protein